ncbi:hypothetical protein JAAARDRAFT_191526 [Jaapia argillacea MUCL 33604]|uniref:Uncharacterized protein n=1 Tax=Jaapia argillacea MUCL 33604 TaxID=933084 RepID=A0A067Q9D1_9AGAM|nr:hypothetical protein JAAARDRAFT_191526 [Jaapia argillacea MUCL 33604]
MLSLEEISVMLPPSRQFSCSRIFELKGDDWLNMKGQMALVKFMALCREQVFGFLMALLKDPIFLPGLESLKLEGNIGAEHLRMWEQRSLFDLLVHILRTRREVGLPLAVLVLTDRRILDLSQEKDLEEVVDAVRYVEPTLTEEFDSEGEIAWDMMFD